MNEKTMKTEKRNTFRPPHGRARVISGEGCVIAWWEAGENEVLPVIKASAVEGDNNHWTISFRVDGSDGLYATMDVSGGSSRTSKAFCRALVASMRGVLGRHVRERINKGRLLEAPQEKKKVKDEGEG